MGIYAGISIGSSILDIFSYNRTIGTDNVSIKKNNQLFIEQELLKEATKNALVNGIEDH